MISTVNRVVVSTLCIAMFLSLGLGAAFAQNPAPTVGSISPISGPAAGGTAVTISGANFLSGATVAFGGNVATNIVFVNSSTITAITPSNSTGGAVNVAVTNPDSQTGTLWAVQQPLTNPGFESGNTGWVTTGFGTAAIITNPGGAHSGQNYAQLTQPPPNTQVNFVALLNGTSQYLPVNPGDVISFGGWAYRVDTVSGDGLARWQIEVTDSNQKNASYITASPNNAPNAQWIQQQNTYTVPSGKAYLRFWCQITGTNGSVTAIANFDDAKLTRTVPGGGFTYVAAPSLLAISPSNGPIAGGTPVTLTGSNFQTGATVTFGTAAATSVTVVNSSTITAVTPANSAGAVNVTVTNPDTQSSTLTNGFSYTLPPPTVTAIAPPSGTTNGGTSVTITGTNFVSGATVTLGGNFAGNVNVANSTTITATTPPNPTGGPVNVTVTNPDSQSGTFYAVQQPLTNGNFEAGSTGWVPSGSGSATVITNPSGAHSGNNYAQVTVPPNTQESYIAVLNGTSQYLPVNPGDVINFGGWAYRVDTNSGDGLARWQIEVTDSNKANAAYISASPNNVTTQSWILQTSSYTIPAGKSNVRFWCQITGTTALNPAQANFDDAFLTRTIPGGGYTYVPPPTLASVTPNGGSTSGGTPVTLNGLNFQPGATVTFGSGHATNVVWVNAGKITALTPANPAGPVNVTVTNPDGQQGSLSMAYTFNLAPTILSVKPSSGGVAGGTSTQITGANFLTGATVTFGGVQATNVTVVTTSQIAATTPPHSAGMVNVVVTNPDGQTGTLTNGFSFLGLPPTISYIAPTSGTSNGGNVVNIHGTNFVSGATVSIGGSPVTITSVGSTLIQGTTTAHVPGGADVVVTNPDTQSATYSSMLYNQGFESGNVRWVFSGRGGAAGSIVNCSSTGCGTINNAHAGTYYAELSTPGGRNKQSDFFVADTSGNALYLPVVPGDVITFGGWAYRVSGDGNARWGIEVTDSTKSNATYVAAPPSNIADPQWELQQGTYTVPSGKAFLRLYCEITGSTVGAVARFDDAILQRSPEGTYGYTYISPGWLNAISPNWGTPTGGTTRTVFGTGFQTGSTVTVGGAAANHVVVNSANAITFFVPAGNLGPADVVVTGPDAQKSNTLAGAYTYQTPPAPPTGMTQIHHILYTMQENRSFDQYFGRMNIYRANNGINDNAVDVMNLNTTLPDIAGQQVAPFHLQTECEENLQPSWNAQHVDYDNGKMDGFMLTGNMFATSSTIDPNGTRAIGYYDYTDLPYYYSLAFQFATSDRQFSSTMANTGANRAYAVAGTSLGSVGNPTPPNGGFPNMTIFDLLDQAGVSWRYYYQNSSPAWIPIWSVYFKDPGNIVPISSYYTDVNDESTFPQVVFIESGSQDEHPKPNPGSNGATGSIQNGANLTSQIIDALLASPTWSSSVMVFTYDEAGGTHDHVVPAAVPIPDGYPPLTKPGTDQPGIFNQAGMRVPIAVISPWTIPHFVSHTVRDHTSILKLIETRFSLPPLTGRDAAADNMLEFFEPNFATAPWLTPPTISSSCNPRTTACLSSQPTNGVCNLNLEKAPGQ